MGDPTVTTTLEGCGHRENCSKARKWRWDKQPDLLLMSSNSQPEAEVKEAQEIYSTDVSLLKTDP